MLGRLAGGLLPFGHGSAVPDLPGDPLLQAALAASHLGGLAPGIVSELLVGASRLTVTAGSTLRRAGDPGAHVELVVDGLVRIYMAAPDGRTLTVRYCRQGSLMGVVSVFRSSYAMLGSIQALVDLDVLVMRAAGVRQLADRELAVARCLLDELSDRVASFSAEIPGTAFATVRQRIARHLMDLASEHQRGPELLAPVSQQELADAVGTVREVVVRTLRDMRTEGLVETGRAGIRLCEPARLYAEVFAPAPADRPSQDGHGGRTPAI